MDKRVSGRSSMWLSGLGAVALLAVSSPAWAQGSEPPAESPMGVKSEMVTVPVTIEDVDKRNRTMTVRTPDGERITVATPGELKELEKVKKGDKVEIDYYQAVAVSLMPPGSTAEAPQTTTAQASNPNHKMGARQVTGSAEVVSVNKTNNTVKLKNASGKTHTVSVQEPAMQRKLQSIAPGDVVQVTYTEAVAVKVRPSGGASGSGQDRSNKATP
jgi:translation initiation factor IF-1